MKKSILITVIAVMSLANASAAMVQKEFTRGLCTSVTVSGDFNVVVSEKYRDNVVVDYDELLKDFLVTEIKGSKLTITYAKGAKKVLKSSNVQKATVYIDRNFGTYVFDGAVTITSAEQLEATELSFTLAGISTADVNIASSVVSLTVNDNSQLTATIAAREAKISMNGAATATVKGSATQLALDIDGSSTFDGHALENQTGLNAKIDGASSAQIVAQGTVKLSANGSSSLSGRVVAKTLSVVLNGVSTANLEGTAKVLKLSLGGSSRFAKSDFAAETSAKLSLKGASSADVTCRGAVDVLAGDTSSAMIMCGSTIKVVATGASTVHYNNTAKLTNLQLKDQATAKAVDFSAVVPVLK